MNSSSVTTVKLFQEIHCIQKCLLTGGQIHFLETSLVSYCTDFSSKAAVVVSGGKADEWVGKKTSDLLAIIIIIRHSVDSILQLEILHAEMALSKGAFRKLSWHY